MVTTETRIVEDGLSVIVDTEDAEVDIVFVHGLNGHPINTWQTIDPDYPTETVYWPRDLLPQTVPKIRVLTFGYPTQFATFYSKEPVAHTTIDEKSTSLITSLGTYRLNTQTTKRPLFFIAHSLGGLVCANGLSRRGNADALGQDVILSTRGLIFLGTPFKGSSMAVWAKMGERFLRLFGDTTPKTITDFDKKSVRLKQISDNFHTLLRERLESTETKPIQVACFFETKSTIVRNGVIKSDLGLIVTAESATLQGYNSIPINKDHRSMCKFSDDQTDGYRNITGKLIDMISKLAEGMDQFQNGRTIITLGDVRQGDNVQNYGIVSGNIVGLVRDANHLSTSHTFNYGEPKGERDASRERDRNDNALRA